jgi:hypothetical protein
MTDDDARNRSFASDSTATAAAAAAAAAGVHSSSVFDSVLDGAELMADVAAYVAELQGGYIRAQVPVCSVCAFSSASMQRISL